MTENSESIDPITLAITECDDYIELQYVHARNLLTVLSVVGTVIVALLATFVFFIFSAQRHTENEFKAELNKTITETAREFANGETRRLPIQINTSGAGAHNSYNNIIVFTTLSAFTVVFCVLMAVYRFHLNEVSKTEHYKIGFIRIRIAADSSRKGYQSEVREALTQMAFGLPAQLSSAGRRTVASPVGGHPVSDAGTALVNRILDSVEIKVLNKGTAANGD